MKDLATIQKNELIILKEIKRICDKHKIIYYLSSGTLLGAIRHGGFIPWDDDIDIEMPLPDYKRFLKVCETELDKRFFLQNYKTDPNDHQAFTKIRMNHTTFMPSHHTKHHIHHGFWVDVFPVVKLPKSRVIQSINKKLIQISNYVQMGDFIKANYDEFYGKLGKVGIKLVLAFNKLPMSFRKKLHSLMLAPVMRNPRHDKLLSYVWTTYDYLPTNIYEELIEWKFENEYFMIPKRYDEYLTKMFGDYMTPPPESERVGHGTIIVDENHDYTYYLD